MDKYFKRKAMTDLQPPILKNDNHDQVQPTSKSIQPEVNLTDLPADPGLRIRISNYNPNDQDEIRRLYLQKGPCQPRNHDFPYTKFGKQLRRFNPAWFNEYGSWLEYSIRKDAAFCLYCYLFRIDNGEQAGGESFVVEGFKNWKKKEKFEVHVGEPNSAHNQAFTACQDLMNQKQHIRTVMRKQSDQSRRDYRVRLNASIDCIRFILRQGLAFRGHGESEDSNNKGNFLELLQFLSNHNESIRNVVLQNAPENLKLTAPDIQKDIVSAVATETTNTIINGVGDALFAILIDESRDISIKEQMAVVLRYVNKQGSVTERFLGIVHVHETTAISLKAAIDELFSKHGLSISRLRGQGYDGASNMQGEFNGLKTLIMKENKYAFYVHCFAHQLQLALVAVARKHSQICSLFSTVSNMVNVVGSSCKRHDILQEKQVDKIIEALKSGELLSGQGLNQETSLKRAGDTRWGSHYGTLLSLIVMFSSVISVLEIVVTDGFSMEKRGDALNLLKLAQTFDFVFDLHLMKTILGITNELSKALQRKEQDIVNAMSLVQVSKQRLQMMRDNGWDSLLIEVSSFCAKENIPVLNMDDKFVAPGRSRRHVEEITNLHHYRAELFYTTIDMQIQELNNRFTEVTTELLLCVACLNPSNSFCAFDKQKLIRLAEFYPVEFSTIQLMALDNQLETYIIDIRSNSEFSELEGINNLAEKMIKTKKDIVYPLVYLLVTLALILPVATATVERAFSAMKILKNRLRNRMGDELMNDCLVAYIEKDIFDSIDNEAIIQRFQNMKTRRGQL
ncbi:hypothetical protein HHK36_021357 [Tetracentron sinense]|uniref:TTF-type domain-containing protein n=1 Tax=Tetracentron sinense TaxID=13715 RepID=A0A834YTW9_TETSI|nr:hypothetical protein HHK36_021357 [Tetracentron sinense]